MKPAPFEYIAPESIEQALTALAQYGDEAKILAGGQSLMPLLNMRLTTPGVVVDINGLEELNYIRQQGERLHTTPQAFTGAKEVGESTAQTAPIAIANAVVDAVRHLGLEITELPLTPDKLWQQLGARLEREPAGT